MSKPTTNQAAQDLQVQILKAKFERVNAEIKVIFDREGVAFQTYMRYSEGGILPMVKLVERKPTPVPTTEAAKISDK